MDTALLYVSHDMLSILQLCERLAVLDEGRIAETLNVEKIETRARSDAAIRLLQTLPAPADVIRRYAMERRDPGQEGSCSVTQSGLAGTASLGS